MTDTAADQDPGLPARPGPRWQVGLLSAKTTQVLIALLAVIVCAPSTLDAQQTAAAEAASDRAGSKAIVLSLVDYLVGGIGDSWLFDQGPTQSSSSSNTSSNEEPWLLTVSERARVRGAPARRWEDSDGNYYLLALDSQAGLRLLETETLDGRRLRWSDPEPILPPQVEVGQSYRSESDYLEMSDGSTITEGRWTTTATVLREKLLQTPAGSFENCLRLRVELLAVPTAGNGHGIELQIDFAKGRGPVQIRGEHFELSANGQRTRRRKVDRRLREAQLVVRAPVAPG